MNNTPNTGGRKKRVTQGKGKVGKGEQVAAGGPVGGQESRPDAKPQQPQQQRENVTRRSGSILPILLIFLVLFLLMRTCSSSDLAV